MGTKAKNLFYYILLLLFIASPAVGQSGGEEELLKKCYEDWKNCPKEIQDKFEKLLPEGWKIWKEGDYPSEYYSKEIKARIVDEAGKPIEGAVVVAQWIVYTYQRPPVGGTDRIGVAEAVTDKDGWFTIPPQGPMKRPRYTVLEDRDPDFAIFKVGYKALFIGNASKEYIYKHYKGSVRSYADYSELERSRNVKPWEPLILPKTIYKSIDDLNSDLLEDITRNEGILSSYREAIMNNSVRDSIWDGKTITLRKPKDEEEYWDKVRFFMDSITSSGWIEKPDWKKIKNAVLEVEKAKRDKPKKRTMGYEMLWELPEDAKKIIYGEGKP